MGLVMIDIMDYDASRGVNDTMAVKSVTKSSLEMGFQSQLRLIN